MSECCSCPCPGVTSDDAFEGAGLSGAGVLFMHRLTAAPVAPPVDAGWNALAPYFERHLLAPWRGDVADTLASLAGVARTVLPAGTNACEYQSVSPPFRGGVVLTTALAWMIIQAGSLVGIIEPRICFRVVDFTGAIVRAVLLPVGFHGIAGGSPYAGSNNYTMPAVRAPGAVPYVMQEGDRLVLENGGFSAAGGEFNCGYGSRAIAFPSQFELSMHVMGFQNVGNPGTRVGYFELDHTGWTVAP